MTNRGRIMLKVNSTMEHHREFMSNPDRETVDDKLNHEAFPL
jgi:hypothetical protein